MNLVRIVLPLLNPEIFFSHCHRGTYLSQGLNIINLLIIDYYWRPSYRLEAITYAVLQQVINPLDIAP